jgi:ribosomal protein L7Ae-like RNA K-turn-binding protein
LANISLARYRPKYTRRYERNAVRRDKAETLIGFAVKAAKTVFGADTLERAKTRYYVIIVCKTASGNTLKKITEIAAQKKTPVIVAENELQYTVGRKNCKVIAITDRQMSEAIMDNLGENYHLINSEVM